MEKIDSFKVDHTKLLRGIYVSRKDYLSKGDVVTTFDLRMKEPNREPAIGQAAIHTIEHLGATYLRNHATWGDKVVYFGPMGCCTGFYLLLSGDLMPKDILSLITEMFVFCLYVLYQIWRFTSMSGLSISGFALSIWNPRIDTSPFC